MSMAAAIRSPLFHRTDPAFDMRDSSGITLPPIRAAHSSRPSLELPSMKAILAVASSHLFSTDRHQHYSQTSSSGQGASLCSTFRSQTNCSASSTARFEKESTIHPPPMCEYLCQALTALAHNRCGDLSPKASRHRSALCHLQLSPWLLPLPKGPLCHTDRTITTLLPYY